MKGEIEMKKIQKTIAILLSALFLLCLVTGCAQTSEKQGESAKNEQTTMPQTPDQSDESAESEKRITLGVEIWSTDDGLGADAKRAIDALAAALDIDVIYQTGDFDAESQITGMENLIAAGVDGVVVTPVVDTSTDELLRLCEEAGIPMQLMFRNIIDEEAKDYCMASSYFSGYVVEDEAAAGIAMVDKLVEEGCKTIGVVLTEAGDGVCDRRSSAVLGYLDQLGLPYYTATHSVGADGTERTNTMQQLLSAYAEIDGVILISGANNAIDADLVALQGTNIKITSFDTPANIASSFDAGNLAMLTTGAQIDPFYATICLYRRVSGNAFSDAPVEIYSNYIYLQTAEDAANYDAHFSTFQTYNEEQIRDLTKMSLEEFKAEVSGYSMERVVNQ